MVRSAPVQMLTAHTVQRDTPRPHSLHREISSNCRQADVVFPLIYAGADPTRTALAAKPNMTTPITTAFWASRYLGKFDATFDRATNRLTSLVGNPILLGQFNSSNNVTPDPEAQVRTMPRLSECSQNCMALESRSVNHVCLLHGIVWPFVPHVALPVLSSTVCLNDTVMRSQSESLRCSMVSLAANNHQAMRSVFVVNCDLLCCHRIVDLLL